LGGKDMNWLIGIIVGALAGWLAGKIMDSKHGFIVNLILGIIGSSVGTFIFKLLNIQANGTLGSFVCSVIGACAVIWLGRIILK